MSVSKYPMGWNEEWFDGRDHYYVPQHRVNTSALGKVDLRTDADYGAFWRDPYNQNPFGTCVANACAAAFAYEWKRQGFSDLDPSRFFIFYNARALGQQAGVVGSDPTSMSKNSGTYVRLAMKVLKDSGVCDSSAWAYEGPNFGKPPDANAVALAKNNVALEYCRLDPDNPGALASTLSTSEKATISEMALLRIRQCLAEGFPVVFGFYFPKAPEDTIKKDDQTQEWVAIDLPPKEQRSPFGAHCVVAIGYDDEKKRLRCQNSWGPDKMGPFFYMGYDWIRDFDATADFWMLRLVAQGSNTGTPIVVAREVKL